MKNLPKKLKTMADIKNCYYLVKNEGYDAQQFLSLLDSIKGRNYTKAFIREILDDGKTIIVNYCAEALVNGIVTFNESELTILSVNHNDGKPDESGNVNKESSTIKLSDAISLDSIYLNINNNPSIYDQMNLDKNEFDAIYNDIKNLL